MQCWGQCTAAAPPHSARASAQLVHPYTVPTAGAAAQHGWGAAARGSDPNYTDAICGVLPMWPGMQRIDLGRGRCSERCAPPRDLYITWTYLARSPRAGRRCLGDPSWRLAAWPLARGSGGAAAPPGPRKRACESPFYHLAQPPAAARARRVSLLRTVRQLGGWARGSASGVGGRRAGILVIVQWRGEWRRVDAQQVRALPRPSGMAAAVGRVGRRG